MLEQRTREEYKKILEEELVVALGCTEPIALAYASAKAREVLGEMPERIVAYCSGDIIKNVKCVNVPNAGMLKGVGASVIIGAVGGDASKKLEVLTDLQPAHITQTETLLEQGMCKVKLMDSDVPLHIIIEAEHSPDKVRVELKGSHTNICRIEKNGTLLYENGDQPDNPYGFQTDRSLLNVRDIVEYANTVDIETLRPLLERQIHYNLAIAEEGLSGKYGVGIGVMLLKCYPDTPINRARAYASAASEARMSGCSMPVVINSGSGNQGIASSVPVVIYGRAKGYPEENILRALAFSNLMTIHQKDGIGRLSAFCGVVCAASSSGAAMAYLDGGTLEQIEMVISNSLANVSGIICDGAKPSCGAKIASSLDAAIMGYNLAMGQVAYQKNDGILQEEVEGTIATIGRIGKTGMRSLDKEILSIMLGE